MHPTIRKTKKSYSLSPEAIAFLEIVRKKRRAESASSVLEDILQAARRDYERASISQAVTDYYSGLTAREVAELAEWGEFATTQFPAEGRD